jgi:hypothetical protein
MKPTDAGTDRYSPEKKRASTPPMDANGKTVMIRAAKRTELKRTKRRKKIAAIVIGTMIIRWCRARCMLWNCPPHSIK